MVKAQKLKGKRHKDSLSNDGLVSRIEEK